MAPSRDGGYRSVICALADVFSEQSMRSASFWEEQLRATGRWLGSWTRKAHQGALSVAL